VSEPEQAEQPSKPRLEPLLQRATGVPGLFVAVYSAVGFSIYFSLGVVADRGLGLTPPACCSSSPRSATSRAAR